MYNETDVRFIDAHPKCNRSHNHLHVLVQKHILPFRPQLAVESSVVSPRTDAIHFQNFSKLFGCFSVECIDDAALPSVLMNELDDAFEGLVLCHLGSYFIFQVGPVER